MAKIKNLFVGCPVRSKADDLLGIVILLSDDDTCLVNYPCFGSFWHKIKEVQLMPFAEPSKVWNHLNRF